MKMVFFISQDKYVAEILKKFDFLIVKTASTPIETKKPLVKDEEATDVDTLCTAGIKVNTARLGTKLVLAGKVSAARQNLVLPGKVGAARHKFWNTATSQTIKDEKQVHAIVDSKAVVVTKASMRSSLLFNDADGTACLTNEAIFQNLALMGYEGELNKLTFQKPLFSPQWKYLIHIILHCLSTISTSWNEFSTNIASAVICLATNQKFNFSKLIFDEGEGSGAPTEPQPTPSPTHPSIKDQPSVTESSSSHDATQDTLDLNSTNRSEGDQVQSPHDSPLLGGHTSDRAEGALNLEELFSICANLSNRVLALETVKDAQAAKIIALKARIKKLGLKKGVCIQTGEEKDKKHKPKPTLDDSPFDADLGINYIDTEEPVNEQRISKETKELVSTGRPGDSTVRPDVGTADPIVSSTTTTSIFNDEDITMAQTLIKMKEEKAKEKGVSIKDIKDSSRPARSILTLKLLPTIDPKDKGKGVLEEPEPVKKMTRSDLDAAQIVKDAKVARLVYEKGLAELEMEKEKRQREEEASKAAIA
nr:hypothetical protein [Tanacetum cinerariifolium]